jgi:hypothetical protein
MGLRVHQICTRSCLKYAAAARTFYSLVGRRFCVFLFAAPTRELLKKEVVASPANQHYKGVGRPNFFSLSAECVRVYVHLEKLSCRLYCCFVSGNYKKKTMEEVVYVCARAVRYFLLFAMLGRA